MTNKEAAEQLKNYHYENGTVPQEITLAIKALENEPKKGEWIKEDKPWGGFGDRVLVNTCPFCKESFVYHGNDPKFCPNCGAEMKEDEK